MLAPSVRLPKKWRIFRTASERKLRIGPSRINWREITTSDQDCCTVNSPLRRETPKWWWVEVTKGSACSSKDTQEWLGHSGANLQLSADRLLASKSQPRQWGRSQQNDALASTNATFATSYDKFGAFKTKLGSWWIKSQQFSIQSLIGWGQKRAWPANDRAILL